MKKSASVSLLAACVLLLHPLSATGAEEKSFSGEISGKVAGVGAISGPLSFTVQGDKVTGAFSGASSTGDAFRGTIIGTYDDAGKTLAATYSGTFDRMLGKKKHDTIPVSGPFKGSGDPAKMTGTWGGRANGTWSAAALAEAEVPAPKEEKAAEEAVCIDYNAEYKKMVMKYGLPMGQSAKITMLKTIKEMKELEVTLAALRKKPVEDKKAVDDNTPKEVRELMEKQQRIRDLYLMTVRIMKYQHDCANAAIRHLR